jgi:hypothetical protein
MATTFTGIPYKRGQAEKAEADLKAWYQLALSSLPVVEQPAR